MRLALITGASGLIIGALVATWYHDAELSALQAQHATASQQATEAARQREAALRNLITEIDHDATQKQAALAADLDASRSIADSLRGQLAAVRARSASGNTATASECDAARTAAGVLADLLTELDGMAGAFAEHADRTAIAGAACRDAYSAVSTP